MKNKILLLILGSLLLAAAYLLYKDYMKSTADSTFKRSQEEIVVNNPQIPVFSENMTRAKSAKLSRSVSAQSNSGASQQSIRTGISKNNYAFSAVQGNQQGNTSSVKRKISTDDDIASFSVKGTMLVSSRAAGASALTNAASGGVSSPAVSTTLMGAPTAPSSNVVLVDPMTDPDPNSMIPVGDGMGILVIVSLIYGLIVGYKRRGC